uniref:Metalloendopeptidase n=1 Tax=Strongyloides venezuelensis TaxID=75913 RepID=A0A0K0F3J1_STRVS
MQGNLLIYLLLLLHLECNALEENLFERYERSMKKHKVLSHPTLPKDIDYYIEFDNKSVLENYLGYISSQTCLNFNKTENNVEKTGINFLKSQNKTKISFPKNINESTNVYMKESDFNDKRFLNYHLGLALGLVPEIQREDRDKYVKIYLNNVTSEAKSYYKTKKYKSKHFTSFDYGSIMLLSPTYGSINNSIAYKTNLYPYYDLLIDKRTGFSHYDFKILSDKYCRNMCPQLECQNGGFPSPDCKKCICNYFFTGDLCQNILTYQSKSCGNSQYYNASSKLQFLTADNLQGPCYYWIKSNKKRDTKIIVESLTFDEQVTCTSDKGLFIYYKKDKGVTPLCLFQNVTKFTVPKMANDMYIIFNGKGLSNSFNISYQSLKKNKN